MYMFVSSVAPRVLALLATGISHYFITSVFVFYFIPVNVFCFLYPIKLTHPFIVLFLLFL